MKKAMVAKLLDHFGVSLDAYAKLTDRQIMDLYYHRRTREGDIDTTTATGQSPGEVSATEEETPTLESELFNLNMVALMTRMDPAEVEKARVALRAKFARQQQEAAGGDDGSR